MANFIPNRPCNHSSTSRPSAGKDMLCDWGGEGGLFAKRPMRIKLREKEEEDTCHSERETTPSHADRSLPDVQCSDDR